MDRLIVLDTETTGLKTADNHKIIELGCVEIINRDITGNYYETLINPEREIDQQATQVHNIDKEKLIDKPKFYEILKDFLKYIENSTLIIHNKKFDLEFLNYELKQAQKNHNFSYKFNNKELTKIEDVCKEVICSLELARKKYMTKSSLDDLCKKYGISLEGREKHNALLDARLTAKVYLKLTADLVENIQGNLVEDLKRTVITTIKTPFKKIDWNNY